jgi:predicted CXXCH cytochrome family protein
MLAGIVLLALFLFAVLVVVQTRSALGARRGTWFGMAIAVALGGAWCALEWAHRREPPPPENQTTSQPASSESCIKCHEAHYTSWQRTYHRTMTREATPENVKARFDGASHDHLGVTSRLIREGDRYFMDTVDPAWAAARARDNIPLGQAGPAPRRKLSVDRLVGSHWFQQLLHRDEQGRYLRLPLAYHLVEERWVHINGVFLSPESDQFHSNVAIWNETCLYCHNTRPSKNPVSLEGESRGYRTEVAELGISCEACHGAGERHAGAHQNLARRLAQHYSTDADPTIFNPAKHPPARADQVCARCHGGPMPRFTAWNPFTHADPFLAGRDLTRFWHVFWSEQEMRLLVQGKRAASSLNPKHSLGGDGQPIRPGPQDGRFWGDGTPLTTALEYQGMALSACYEDGRGQMSCLSCHSMHDSEPNHQLKGGMRTNAACYACHGSYRERLAEHTHHAADSPGSLCYNCHMPHQVYSLLDIHRSHRISVPRVRDSLGTGKPHACNLCHLDKSLGWTQEQLARWYKTPPEPLSDDERSIASSVLHLAQDDARTRAVMAGAFAWPPAQQASGRDWPVALLTRVLEHERYQAVRYTAHKALRSLHGRAAERYDYQADAAKRSAQLQVLRLQLADPVQLDPGRHAYLPMAADGRFADEVFQRLLRNRNDPDVTINE